MQEPRRVDESRSISGSAFGRETSLPETCIRSECSHRKEAGGFGSSRVDPRHLRTFVAIMTFDLSDSGIFSSCCPMIFSLRPSP